LDQKLTFFLPNGEATPPVGQILANMLGKGRICR